MKPSPESVVPTYILQADGPFREGLRLILSATQFRPQGCGTELEDLSEIPTDVATVFIVGVGQQKAIHRRIRAQYPLSSILVVGDEYSRKDLIDALANGANGALLSSVTSSALIGALRAIVSGDLVVVDARLYLADAQPYTETPPLAQAMEVESEQPAIRHLSARELAILKRIVHGDSNKHVARFFRIAEPTVKAHVKAIFRKIGANNRTQAAIWALNHGRFEDVKDAAHQFLGSSSEEFAEQSD